MGTNLHYAIEGQDDSGHWHTLFISDLHDTAWWTHHAQNVPHDVASPHAMDAFNVLAWRHYPAYAVLSSVRDPNPFATHPEGVHPSLTNARGVASRPCATPDTANIPDDASPLVRAHLWWDVDRWEQGWLDGVRVAELLRLLKAVPSDHPEAPSATQTIMLLTHVQSAMRLLAGGDGKPGIVGTPIAYVPAYDPVYERDDPSVPVLTKGTSMHTMLAMTALLRSGQGLPPDRLRIVLSYA